MAWATCPLRRFDPFVGISFHEAILPTVPPTPVTCYFHVDCGLMSGFTQLFGVWSEGKRRDTFCGDGQIHMLGRMSDRAETNVEPEPRGRWRLLVVLSLAELFALTLWFSGSAVVPQMTEELGLGDGGRSWLTLSVQLGFVVGALASALTNLADRAPLHRVFAICAVVGAAANAIAAVPDVSFGVIVAMRFATGAALAARA